MDISELSSDERTLVGYLASNESGPWNLLWQGPSKTRWVVIPTAGYTVDPDGRLDTPIVRSQESVRSLESKGFLQRDTFFDTLQLSEGGKRAGQQILEEARAKAA